MANSVIKNTYVDDKSPSLSCSGLCTGQILVKCPVCGTGFSDRSEMVHCQRCLTIHHNDCFQYNGQCATYGCGCSQSIRSLYDREHDYSPPSSTVIPIAYLDTGGSFSRKINHGIWIRETPLTYRFLTYINTHSELLYASYDLLISLLIILLPFIYFVMWRHRINLWIFMTIWSEIIIITLKKEYLELCKDFSKN